MARPEFEQHIALFGESGSGKTVLLSSFYGAAQDATGRGPGTGRQLYDLVADPREMTNVAGDPAYAQALAEMQELTAQMQAEVGDAPYAGPDTPRLEWPTAR